MNTINKTISTTLIGNNTKYLDIRTYLNLPLFRANIPHPIPLFKPININMKKDNMLDLLPMWNVDWFDIVGESKRYNRRS